MLQQLINHSPDIKHLLDDGFDVAITESGGHILVRQIPYLNLALEVKYGTMFCPLTRLTPNKAGKPDNHTMHFIGEAPTHANGIRMDAIINNSNRTIIAENLVADHFFSSRPITGDYIDYYEKFRTYAQILHGEVLKIDKSVTYTPLKKNLR
jgi:hypothetical protein